ncbi:ketopantoate reductase family protein [Gordonia paraffinivorans]|uniref:2-dehydropantoate 2-reductase n=1 Tax=Gordonia paraffinivorans TaxID=175628 RepID=A0ABD7V1J1_9ACTN|nr:2-dehydropantoate 2-reductase N-terminal domain-containing protein [Gordonia paraffinivorans]VFA88253.1 2-dehydropantoate 2-reductase [Gordonia paraffinivorans]
MSRYVVIGAGAVGSAVAAGFSDAGIPVVLVSRGRTYQAIRERGLRYTHNGRTRTLDVDVVPGPDTLTLTPDDVLVLAVKTQDVAAALAEWAWRPVVSGGQTVGAAADLPIVLLQNGLEAERAALRYFDKVLGAITLTGARHVVTGEIHVANSPLAGQIIVGPYPSGVHGRGSALAATAESVVADLSVGGWLSQSVPDIERWLAWKTWISSTFAVGVLRGTDAELDELTDLVRDEARRVLIAAGHEFADPSAEVTYDANLAAIAPESGYGKGQQSTWQSFERGVGSEVDHLNGEIVAIARRHGLDAPFNAALQHVLGRSADAGEGPRVHLVDEVLARAAAPGATRAMTIGAP